MQPVFLNLFMIMVVVWTAAWALRRVGVPLIMGELVMGVVLGPAVLGWVEPSEVITILAEMGIFFIMLHAGVKTDPDKFYGAVKLSIGVALVGAIVPFSVAMSTALLFGLDWQSAVFVGLTMTATAVVITITVLEDLKLLDSRVARVIVAACVTDDLITLIVFSMALGLLNGAGADPVTLMIIMGKTIAFFAVVISIGHWLYPKMREPFKDRHGKVFTFMLVLALLFGLVAEAIGLHIVLGAYMAGLFFTTRIATVDIMYKVEDRLHGIAYSFLGPVFFVSLGLQITFDVFTGAGLWFMVSLTLAVLIGQIASASGMSRVAGLTWAESLSVGVGMCGRAEMAFILASLGLSMGLIDVQTFSVLLFTAFLLNLFTPVGLMWSAKMLRREHTDHS